MSTGRGFPQQQPNPPMNQPAPMAPNQGGVPDQRWEQVQREIRDLRDQNSQLRGQVDHMARAGQPNQPPPASIWKPEVDQALTEKFQRLIQPLQQQFTQATGVMVDRTDRAEFQLKWNQSHLAEYMPAVEAEMARLQQAGKWMPREQLLQQMYFEQTGKKPQQPNPGQAPAPQLPQYDTYTGQWKDPATGQIVQPPSQVVMQPGQVPQAVPQMQAAQPGQFTQPGYQYPQPQINPGYQPQPPTFPFAQPPQPQYQQQQQPPAGAQANPQQWTPNLPSGAPPPAGATPGGNSAVSGLDLNSSEATLSAWADRHGDVPI